MSEEIPQNAGGLRPLYRSYKRQKCFVGHSHEASWCADIVSACEEALPEFGLEPWYAAHNFDPTRPLRDKVVEMIANARYGIYDLSYWRKSNKGDWEMPRNVLIELGMGIVLNRPMLLLQYAESRKLGPELPECLKSVDEYILKFSGEGTLKRILRERLPEWVNVPPKRDWWNRYCLFGGMECKYREVHPQGAQLGKEKLHCHISDGLDEDRLDFREVVGKVLKRFSDVEFNYLDNLPMSSGYNFLLCTHCQTVRSTPFAIYRISPETSGETFIAIGMSIALEKQFEYKIPKILLTGNMQDIPSVLTGYEVAVARNDQDRKNRLREFVPEVIQKVRETTWKPRPLPFEVFVLKQDEVLLTKDRKAIAEEEEVRTNAVSSPFDEALISASKTFVGRTADLQWMLERLRMSSITALHGMAGIGKTTLAAVAIRQLHDDGRFPDGIALVRCGGLTNAVEVLRLILARFEPQHQLPEIDNLAKLAEVIRHMLNGKKVLIVLDDVQPELTLEDIVRPLSAAGVTLLLISRQKLGYIGISSEAIHELGPLSEQESLKDNKQEQIDMQTYLERGKQALAEGQGRDAAIAYAHAAQIEPNNPIIHLGLAEANLALGSYGVVYLACRKVQELQPSGGTESTIAQALLDLLDRHYGRALQDVDVAISQDSSNAYLYALRSYLLHLDKQDYDAGIARARAARLPFGGTFENCFPPIETYGKGGDYDRRRRKS